jgi:PAS domain-containing protein
MSLTGCPEAAGRTALPWISGDTALVIARDITVERSLRAALIESRQRYKDLVEASSDFAWETDAEGVRGRICAGIVHIIP